MKKRLLSTLLVLAMLVGVLALMPITIGAADTVVWDGSVASSFAGGSGTQGDPYKIANGAQLAYMAKVVNAGTDSGKYRTAYYVLTSDIVLNTGDAKDWATTAPQNTVTPIGIADNGANDTEWRAGAFNGVFDGNGNTISGVYVVNETAASYNAGTGLFAIAGANATIKNLVVTNSYISANKAVGIIGLSLTSANLSIDSIVSDIYVNAVQAGAGGVVGQLSGDGGGNIANCVCMGKVTAAESAGGILGNGNGKKITISNCLNLGVIKSGDKYESGILGRIAQKNCYINNCVSIGTATYQFVCCSAKESSSDKPTVNNSFYTGTLKTASTIVNDCVQLDSIYDVYGTEVDSSITSVLSGWSTRENDIMVPTTVLSFAPHTEYYVPPVTAPDWLVNYETQEEFEITTAQQLCEFSDWVNMGKSFEGKTVKLGADIDMSGIDFTPIGKNSNLIFKGIFDGNGKTISNLSVAADEAGLFGYIANATVKNFALVGATIVGSIGDYRVGGAIAQVEGSSTGVLVENVYVNATLSGKRHIGGIIGQLGGASTNTVVKNCVFTGSINGTGNYCAGIIGNANNAPATVENCLNAASVTAANYAAGIATSQRNLTITSCVNVGTIVSNSSYFGSIYTGNPKDGDVIISGCYYVGDLMKNNTAGGAEVTEENNTKAELVDLIGENAVAPETFTARKGDVAVPTACTVVASKAALGATMVSGAAVRLADPAGLRFTAVLGADFVKSVAGDSTSYTYGIIIAPTDYVDEAGAFTVEALDKLSYSVKYKKIVAEKMLTNPETDGYYMFTGTLGSIQEANYGRSFSAIAFVEVDGVYYYSYYNETNNARSIAYVAEQALKDTSVEQNDEYKYEIVEDTEVVYSPYTEAQRKILADFFQ